MMVEGSGGRARDLTLQWAESTFSGHGILGNRAGSVIFQLLVALNKPGTGVILPSTTCNSLPYLVEYAGYIPVFADIDANDFTSSTMNTKAAIEGSTVPVSVCIGVHAFGHLIDTANIYSLCKSAGIFFIEDICQILGSSDVGENSDAVVGSFGYSKPIDAGSGGFLVIRSGTLAKETRAVSTAMGQSANASRGDAAKFRSNYMAIRENARRDGIGREQIAELGQKFRSLFIQGEVVEPAWEKVLSDLPFLPSRVEIRNERFEKFQSGLEGLPIGLPQIREGSSPWRFTFALDDPRRQKKFTDTLREAISHVSNLYPSLNLDYGQKQTTPVADRFEKQVVNFWLDQTVSSSYVQQAINHSLDFFEAAGRAHKGT